jgi:predicted Zn-dependent protease
LLAAGNSAEARQGIDAGLARSKTPELLLQDAVLKTRAKDYEHARPVLESILTADPANTSALQLLAQTYINQKLPAIGNQKVHDYAAMRPGSYALQVFAADWLMKHGDAHNAEAAIALAKSDDPQSVVPDLISAQLESGRGNADRARSLLTGVLARDERNMGAHLLFAMIEDGAGNYNQAATHYRRVLDLDPRQVVALNGLAYQLGNHGGQLNEALKFAQQAKELDPANPEVDDTLGWIMFQRGDYRPARDLLQKASAKGQDPVIKYHLAMACFKLGDVSQGRQVLRAALEANGKLPEAAKAQEAFRAALSSSR